MKFGKVLHYSKEDPFKDSKLVKKLVKPLKEIAQNTLTETGITLLNYGKQKIHTFKLCQIGVAVNTTTPNSAGLAQSVFTFNLADLPQYMSLCNLFSKFRIKGIKAKLLVNDVLIASNTQYQFYVTKLNDFNLIYDSDVKLTDVEGLPRVKMLMSSEEHRVLTYNFKPYVFGTVGTGETASALAQQVYNKWFDTSYTTVLYNALLVLVNSAPSGLGATIDFEYTVQFKDQRNGA